MYFHLHLCKPKLGLKLLLSFVISISILICFSTGSKAEEASSSIKITHVHTGNKTDGGGCYKKAVTEMKQREERCPGKMIYYPEWDATQCNKCGAGYSGDQSWRDCYTVEYIEYESHYWTLSCGMGNNATLGEFAVTTDNDDWSSEVHVTCTVTPATLLKSDTPFSVNDIPLDGNEYTITENGDYTFSAELTQNTSGNKVSLSVRNIDTTAPVISTEYDESPQLPVVTLTVHATDMQPDLSEGSGLADEAYSYDGGSTWCSQSSYEIKKNGDYTICVRDKCNNIASAVLSISNIKKPVETKKDNNSGGNKPSDNNNNNQGDNNSGGDNSGNDNSDNSNTEADDDTGSIEVPPTPDIIVPPVPKTIKSIPEREANPPQPIINGTKDTKPAVTALPSKPVTTYKESTTTQIPVTQPKADNSALEVSSMESDTVKNPFSSLPFILITGAVSLGLLSAVVLLWICSCAIYNYKGKEKYRLIGFSLIHKRDGLFELKLSEKITDCCDTGLIIIKPSFIFVLLNKNKDLTVYLHNKQAYTVQIENSIKLTLKSM